MGIFSLVKSVFHTEAVRSADSESIQNNLASDTRKKFDLQEWINRQMREYGSREGLSQLLKEKARIFNKELLGINGPVVNDLLTREPLMIPSDFWGADIGWRSARRKERWEKLLMRSGVNITPDNSGILIRFYFNAAEWVPHPYAPPSWVLMDYNLFSHYITPDESAYVLCQTWRAENAIVLTHRLLERLKSYSITLGASYRSYNHTDYAEVGFLYSAQNSAFKVKTVWRGETELFQLIQSVFPDAYREYSPDWLCGQRLDVYVPSIRTAFEYQGEQHFTPVEFFGGELGHQKTRERDAIKKQACQRAGVLLIEWMHNERITKEHLIKRLKEYSIEEPNNRNRANSNL